MAVHQRDSSCGSLWLQQQPLQMELVHAAGLQGLQGLQGLSHPHQLGPMGVVQQLSQHQDGIISQLCSTHSSQGTPSHHVHAHVHQSNGN